jgi:branched-chain amino acid transport system substrate-binding protein
MHRISRLSLLGAALALAIAACGSSSSTDTGAGGTSSVALSPATGTPITLGWIGTESGSQAGVIAVEKQELGGVLAYLGWANDHGGVDGHPIKIDNADDMGDPNTALTGAKRLVEQAKVPALLFVSGGPLASAVVPYVTQQKVPLLGTAAPLLCFFQPVNPYVYGELTPYEYQGSALATYLVKQKGAKKIAYAGFNDVSGKSFGSTFVATAKQLGAELVLPEQYFKRGQTDFSALVSQLGDKKPDAVGFFGSIQESAAVLKAAQAGGLSTTWGWGPGGTNPELAKLAGQLSDGTFGVSPFVADTTDSTAVKDYKANLQKYQSSITSGPYTEFGYVLGHFAVDVLKAAKGTYTPEAIRAAAESISGDYGLMAPFQLGPTNHLLNTGIQVVSYKGTDLQPASDFIRIDPASVKPYPCSA